MKIDPLEDGISSVELIGSLGDDLTVVNAARVSMLKHKTELDEKDAKLINYLANHKHWTPFSHVMFTFRIKMPIFVARQWYKHQVGFTRNEVSRRYVDEKPEIYIPSDGWRLRAENVKQGSSSKYSGYEIYERGMTKELMEQLVNYYEDLIDTNIAPEQARMVLPQSMYTEFYETASLAGYGRLCQLRMDAHAQLETQLYAEAIASMVGSIVPLSWEALLK